MAKLFVSSDKSSLQRSVSDDAQGTLTSQSFLFVVSFLAFLSLKFAVDYRAQQYKVIQRAFLIPGRLSLQRPFFFRPPPAFIH
ncbi:MAG TPA: hypothetical protein VFA02_03925 [Pseudacidobacterium sp.]|nr:hypothetical protein [Pseudacidobacterium sp.]